MPGQAVEPPPLRAVKKQREHPELTLELGLGELLSAFLLLWDVYYGRAVLGLLGGTLLGCRARADHLPPLPLHLVRGLARGARVRLPPQLHVEVLGLQPHVLGWERHAWRERGA